MTSKFAGRTTLERHTTAWALTLCVIEMLTQSSTRPDIAQARLGIYPVGALSKYMAGPTPSISRQVAKGLMRYVASAREHGIVYWTQPNFVIGYGDADYAGDLDTRRWSTGYVFFPRGGAEQSPWMSKQSTGGASTKEAEYIATAQATKEVLRLRSLLNDLGLTINTFPVMAVDQSALKLLNYRSSTWTGCDVHALEAHRRGLPLCK